MAEKPLLEVKGISKSFGGVQAVTNVSFDLFAGDVLGIIGPNGSGKTTLANLISGFLKTDSGEIHFRGKRISGLEPYKIVNMGLARTFQVVKPYPTLKAYKHLIVPLLSPRVRQSSGGKTGNRDAIAIDILEDVGFERDAFVPYKPASALPLGYLKRLELARCLALRPDMIICDEVFSGLTVGEIGTMVPLIEKLHLNGVTMIMIEHRLRELFQVANRVMAIQFGSKITEGVPKAVMSDKRVREAYIGVEIEL